MNDGFTPPPGYNPELNEEQYQAAVAQENMMKREGEKISKEKAGADSVEQKKWQRKTAADILEADYPELKWVVPGLIPEGLTKIDGAPKLGKSWFTLHLATAVSCGGCFMGCIPVEQREVLYLALEDGERRIKNRLLEQGGQANNKLFVETAASWKGGIATLRAYLKEYPQTGLVIVDTLFRFSPMTDTNSYADTYGPISAIQQIATETGIPIVSVHHTRKGANSNRGEAWADEGMGSQGIAAAVDTQILLQRQDGKNEGSMRIRGRDVEEKHFNISFDSDICTWKISGESEIEKIQDTKARTDVIAVLEKAGPEGIKTGDIAKALEKSPSAISNTLKILEGLDRVKSAGYGKWTLSQFHEVSEINENESMKVPKPTFTVSHTPRENESVKAEREEEPGKVIRFPEPEEDLDLF
jgi:RecA-family ATPase